MPQIAPNTWKVASEFYWCREYQDGRIECEFDTDTGEVHLWGPVTPRSLVRVGWLPMTSELARLIQAHGEFGRPTSAPPVFIDLKPDDVLICEKDCGIIRGYQVTCKACGASFKTTKIPEICPKCGSHPSWKCDICDEIQESEVCPKCQNMCRKIDPFSKHIDLWEDVVYHLGIKGKFLIKFNGQNFFVKH